MFSEILKRLLRTNTAERIATQPFGETFPWLKDVTLTALDDVVIAFPAALIGEQEAIGTVIHCDNDDARISILGGPHHSNQDYIYLNLRAGMSAYLSKSSQAAVVSEDKKAKRFRITDKRSRTT